MIGSLKKHDLRKIWKNEATDFTTWLEVNLETLSDAVGFDLTLVKREHRIGGFSADIVATDQNDQKVVIENQLERTDHGHLGQIITYVSNLNAKTVIWISSDPRQEHINAVNWLNTQTELNFYLIRLEAVSVDDSAPAPLFQIICRPDEELKSAASAEMELSERDRFNIQFWTEINKKCETKLPGFTSRKPKKYHFHGQASGRGGLSFVFLATSKYYGIELYIDVKNSELNEAILNQLKSSQKNVERDFGRKLDFDPIPEKRACRVRYIIGQGQDIMSLDRDKVEDELISNMIRFQAVMQPLIRGLNLDDLEVA